MAVPSKVKPIKHPWSEQNVINTSGQQMDDNVD
ncbi:unnamed protein product, partial [Rotaria sp. Silwood1]